MTTATAMHRVAPGPGPSAATRSDGAGGMYGNAMIEVDRAHDDVVGHASPAVTRRRARRPCPPTMASPVASTPTVRRSTRAPQIDAAQQVAPEMIGAERIARRQRAARPAARAASRLGSAREAPEPVAQATIADTTRAPISDRLAAGHTPIRSARLAQMRSVRRFGSSAARSGEGRTLRVPDARIHARVRADPSRG